MQDDFRTISPGGFASGPSSRRASVGDDDITVAASVSRSRRFVIGDVLLGRYRILSELGQGGMGVVYKCFDQIAGIEVALKALPPELSHNSAEMEDVRENFQLVSRLIHQNIAVSKTLEKDSVTGDYYLVMECVEGEDLKHWLKKHKTSEGGVQFEEVLPILRQVAEALDYAHGERIIHRDIKPSNIMVSAEGKVKVLDFGLAAQIHTSLSRVSMAYHGTSGTSAYMSPEQWEGHAQDARTDQYALGVMVYEMLAGHVPFENSDAAVLQQIVLTKEPEEIKGLPQTAMCCIRKAMNKKPKERYATCLGFIEDLRIKCGASASSSIGKIVKKFLFVLVLISILALTFCVASRYVKNSSCDNGDVTVQEIDESILTMQQEKLSQHIQREKEKNYNLAQGVGTHYNKLLHAYELGSQALREGKKEKAQEYFENARKELAWLNENVPVRDSIQKNLQKIIDLRLKALEVVPELYLSEKWSLLMGKENELQTAFEEGDFKVAQSLYLELYAAYAELNKSDSADSEESQKTTERSVGEELLNQDPRVVFYAPIASDTGDFQRTGAVRYTEKEGVKCGYFDGHTALWTSNPIEGDAPCTMSIWCYYEGDFSPKRMAIMSLGREQFHQFRSLDYYRGRGLLIDCCCGSVDSSWHEESRWIQVMAVFENGHIGRIYRNGELAVRSSIPVLETNRNYLTLGGYFRDDNDCRPCWTGYLACAKIYNRALDASEIAEMYKIERRALGVKNEDSPNSRQKKDDVVPENQATQQMNQDPGVVFYAPITSDTGEFKQRGAVRYTEKEGVKCGYFDGRTALWTSNPIEGDAPCTMSIWCYYEGDFSSKRMAIMSLGREQPHQFRSLDYYWGRGLLIDCCFGSVDSSWHEESRWIQVMAVFENGHIGRIYRNGELAVSSSIPVLETNRNYLTLGGYFRDDNDCRPCWTGYLACAKIYNRALDASEIAEMYKIERRALGVKNEDSPNSRQKKDDVVPENQATQQMNKAKQQMNQDPGVVFYAPITSDTGEFKQRGAVRYTEKEGVKCGYFDGQTALWASNPIEGDAPCTMSIWCYYEGDNSETRRVPMSLGREQPQQFRSLDYYYGYGHRGELVIDCCFGSVNSRLFKERGWIQLAAVFTGNGNGAIYRNGVLVVRSKIPRLWTNRNYLTIGGYFRNDNDCRPCWMGYLACAKIYNRALNANEIAEMCAIEWNMLTNANGQNENTNRGNSISLPANVMRMWVGVDTDLRVNLRNNKLEVKSSGGAGEHHGLEQRYPDLFFRRPACWVLFGEGPQQVWNMLESLQLPMKVSKISKIVLLRSGRSNVAVGKNIDGQSRFDYGACRVMWDDDSFSIVDNKGSSSEYLIDIYFK